jgi:carboxyl-terminal processing protease
MRRILLAFVLCAAALAAQNGTPDNDPASQLVPGIKQITEVYAAVEAQAAEPVSADTAFYQGAIPAMLHTLDPHSSFFDPDQFEQLNQMQQSEQKGFGSIVSVLPGRVIVLQVLPGTPSAKAGLSAGDEVLAINNIPLARLEPDQLIQLLSAARQQKVALDVLPSGRSRLERITMSPELMDSPTVDRSFLIAPGIGYLRITSFEQPTGKLVQDTIEKLGGAKLKGLVVDLRDNHGGAVEAAIETASLFLKPGQLLFTIKGRSAKTQEVRVPKLASPYLFPVAVLVNGQTASASEIVAGALQDHDRATILGQPSYGKGLVQQVYPLSSNTGLALTTAFYYTPSGRSIQKPLNEGQLDPATHVSKGPYKTDSGRLVRGGGGIQPDEVVLPPPDTRLRIALDASGTITSFAGEYLSKHSLSGNFTVTPEMLDQLKAYASAHDIQPGVGEWLADSEWIQSRLQQELVNLKDGVAQGDEIEMKRDPVVQAALKRLP